MRIGLDLITCQFAGRFRGNGRYARGLVRALMDGYPGVCWVPLVHTHHAAARDMLPKWHDDTEYVNLPPSFGDPTLALHAWMNGANGGKPNPAVLDALLVISPFESVVPCAYPGVKTTSIFYDAVPLRCKARYDSIGADISGWERNLQHLKNHNHVFCISRSAQEDLVEFGQVPHRKTSVILGGVNDWFFSLPGEDECRTIRPQVISILDKHADTRKGDLALIEFMLRLPDDYQLLLVGETAPSVRKRVTAAAEKFGILHRVHFVGQVKDEHLRALYRTSAAYLGMSEWEGLYLPAIEAQLCGCQALCVGNSSHPEVVPQIVPIGAWEDRIISDRVHSWDYRRRVRDWAKARFQWSAVAAKVMEVLK